MRGCFAACRRSRHRRCAQAAGGFDGGSESECLWISFSIDSSSKHKTMTIGPRSQYYVVWTSRQDSKSIAANLEIQFRSRRVDLQALFIRIIGIYICIFYPSDLAFPPVSLCSFRAESPRAELHIRQRQASARASPQEEHRGPAAALRGPPARAQPMAEVRQLRTNGSALDQLFRGEAVE